MRHGRIPLFIVAGMALGLLIIGGSFGVLALTQSGWLGSSGNGSRMMNGRPSFPGTMMGGYQPGPAQQETPITGTSHLTITIVTNQPGKPKDWPAFSPANLVAPANSLVTVTIRDDDLGDTALPQNSPWTRVQGTANTMALVDG